MRRRASSRTRQDAAGDVPGHAALRQQTITALERANALLRAALDAAAARAQEARATAQAARDARALLLQMLQDMPHRYDRLLDMPRSAAIPPQSPQDRLGATQAAPPARRRPVAPLATPGDARGAMRRRIVALLKDYPEGLTPAEIRDQLGVGRSLADTLLGMLGFFA